MTNSSNSERDVSTGKIVAGSALTVVERVIAQASQLAIFVVAARSLTPEEFGVFSIVSACAILLLRFAEVGWAPYIMSWKGDDTVPRQVLFVAILSGAAVGLLGAVSSLSLGLFGLGMDVTQLMLLFSLWVAMATASAAQKGLLIWRDRIRTSAFIEISGELIGLGVAISALLSGYGVFALVFGRLAYQVTHLTLSSAATRMFPKPGMRGDDLRDMVTFSLQVFSNRMIANFRLYAATFIIGGFLGPAAVGYYRAAERLVGALGEVIGVPSIVLAWSLFRQARDRNDGRLDGFQAQANTFFKLMLAVSIPTFVWLVVLGEDIVSGLLGSEWLPALPIIGILALSRAIQHPGMATEPVMSLAGEIRRLIPFTVFYFVLTVLVTVVGAKIGLYAVAWSQVLVAVVVMGSSFWLWRKFASINMLVVFYEARTIVLPMLVGSIFLVVARDSLMLADLAPLGRVAVCTVATLIVYAVAIVSLEPEARRWALSRFGRRKER